MGVSKSNLKRPVRKMPGILSLRLENTGLAGSRFRSAAEAVSSLCAVQAQDFAAAKRALSMRVRGSDAASIEQEYDEGRILRTHVLRPTWHFVTPEDAGWMIRLTAPRVKAVLESYDRKLGLDEALFAKTNDVIVKALGGRNCRTRRELKLLLANTGIKTDVQRLAHIVSRAELDGLITSGPMRGKQVTYALFDERAEKAKILRRDEAAARLALAYFKGHGPAQVADFAWWSGLGAKESRDALESIKSSLDSISTNDKTYWYVPRAGEPPRIPVALLLSIYDEYTIAYKDRSDLSEARNIERMIAMGNALTSVMVINGRVAGTWKKSVKKGILEIVLSPFRELTKREIKALEEEGSRFATYLGIGKVSIVTALS